MSGKTGVIAALLCILLLGMLLHSTGLMESVRYMNKTGKNIPAKMEELSENAINSSPIDDALGVSRGSKINKDDKSKDDKDKPIVATKYKRKGK